MAAKAPPPVDTTPSLHPDYWYIKGQAYDFKPWCSDHPGGEYILQISKGTLDSMLLVLKKRCSSLVCCLTCASQWAAYHAGRDLQYLVEQRVFVCRRTLCIDRGS